MKWALVGAVAGLCIGLAGSRLAGWSLGQPGVGGRVSPSAAAPQRAAGEGPEEPRPDCPGLAARRAAVVDLEVLLSSLEATNRAAEGEPRPWSADEEPKLAALEEAAERGAEKLGLQVELLDCSERPCLMMVTGPFSLMERPEEPGSGWDGAIGPALRGAGISAQVISAGLQTQPVKQVMGRLLLVPEGGTVSAEEMQRAKRRAERLSRGD